MSRPATPPAITPDPVSRRRMDLLSAVLIYDVWRARHHPLSRWADGALTTAMARLGCDWDGRLDREWFTIELTKVKAAPGYYQPGSYERWRHDGVPIWAALGAGLYPTGPRRATGADGRSAHVRVWR